jgi:hypothetical protein
MARDIKRLIPDLTRAIQNVGYQEALLLVDTTLEEMVPCVPVDKGHLINTGFGYVDGKLVATSDNISGVDDTSNLATIEPSINVGVAGEGHYNITISFHSPRPGRNRSFDYAPYVLEGGASDRMIRTKVFQSRRQTAYKGLMKSSRFDKTRLRAAIDRGIKRGLTLSGRRIAYKLAEL